ncbi:MAG: hypothetical protein Q9212_006531 [Teloschistes hypoglaucus]
MPAPGSSATIAPRSTPATPKIPTDLSLIVTYESLEPDQKKESYRGYLGNVDWKPPNIRNAFIRIQTPDAMIRWEGGKATVPSRDDICRKRQMKPHSSATIFVQTDSDNFWAVPFDAETQDVKEHYGGWKVLSFDHERQQGSDTSAVYSCISTVGDQSRLAAGGSPDWMPQLLPKVYDYDPVRSGHEPEVSAGLIGSLPLLFALAAFSAPPEHLSEVLTKHLQPNRWNPHHRKHGRECCPRWLIHGPNLDLDVGTQERGMVVTVYCDPRNEKGSSEKLLTQLEDGGFGPFYQP